MKSNIEEKVKKVAKYYVEEKSTVRETAKKLSISKSTVYFYLTERLKDIDNELYIKAKKLLKENKEERHIRGGRATKKKYKK